MFERVCTFRTIGCVVLLYSQTVREISRSHKLSLLISLTTIRDNVQCNGTTLKGIRCRRRTPNYPAPWYCWDHLKQSKSKSAAPSVAKVNSPPSSSHTVTGESKSHLHVIALSPYCVNRSLEQRMALKTPSKTGLGIESPYPHRG